MKAYLWSPAIGDNRLRLTLYPAPRLQVEGAHGWVDQQPTTWPRTLFAKLAEVLGEIEDLDSETRHEQPSAVLDKCFEVVEIGEDAP